MSTPYPSTYKQLKSPVKNVTQNTVTSTFSLYCNIRAPLGVLVTN